MSTTASTTGSKNSNWSYSYELCRFVSKIAWKELDPHQGTSSSASKVDIPVQVRPLLCFPSRGTRSWYWALFCTVENSSEVDPKKPHTFRRVWIWICKLIRYRILKPNVDTWKFSCNWVVVDVSFCYSFVQLICLFAALCFFKTKNHFVLPETEVNLFRFLCFMYFHH